MAHGSSWPSCLSTVEFDVEANDLGIVLDSQLSMVSHIATTCQYCFCQMHELRSIGSSLSAAEVHALVQAFVYCRLDYCNSLPTGVANVHFKCLQSVQLFRMQPFSWSQGHGTSPQPHQTVLTTLHWLPVCKRVMFKLWTLCSSCLCFRSLASQVSLDGLTASS